MTSYPNDLPSASSTSPPEDRFDDILRQRLTDFEADPTPSAWPTLSAQLPQARPAGGAWRAQVGSFTAGMVAGALLWWGTSQFIPDPADFTPSPITASTPRPALTPRPADAVSRSGSAPALTPPAPAAPTEPPLVVAAQPGVVAPRLAGAGLPGRSAAAPKRPAVPLKHVFAAVEHPAHSAYPAETGGADKHATEAPEPAKASRAAITSFVRLSGVETRDSIIRQRARAYMKPATVAPDTLRTARLRVLVAEQTRDLSMLQARLDSVKRFLPEAPTSAPSAPKPPKSSR